MEKKIILSLIAVLVLTEHSAMSGSNFYGAGGSHRSWGRGKYSTNTFGGSGHSRVSGSLGGGEQFPSVLFWMNWFRRNPEDLRWTTSPPFEIPTFESPRGYNDRIIATTEASSHVLDPDSMTTPSETTTTTARTTTGPYCLAYNVKFSHKNGAFGYKYLRVSGSYNDPNGKNHNGMVHKISRSYFDTTRKPTENKENED